MTQDPNAAAVRPSVFSAMVSVLLNNAGPIGMLLLLLIGLGFFVIPRVPGVSFEQVVTLSLGTLSLLLFWYISSTVRAQRILEALQAAAEQSRLQNSRAASRLEAIEKSLLRVEDRRLEEGLVLPNDATAWYYCKGADVFSYNGALRSDVRRVTTYSGVSYMADCERIRAIWLKRYAPETAIRSMTHFVLGRPPRPGEALSEALRRYHCLYNEVEAQARATGTTLQLNVSFAFLEGEPNETSVFVGERLDAEGTKRPYAVTYSTLPGSPEWSALLTDAVRVLPRSQAKQVFALAREKAARAPAISLSELRELAAQEEVSQEIVSFGDHLLIPRGR